MKKCCSNKEASSIDNYLSLTLQWGFSNYHHGRECYRRVSADTPPASGGEVRFPSSIICSDLGPFPRIPSMPTAIRGHTLFFLVYASLFCHLQHEVS
jgi:hypothetical protein